MNPIDSDILRSEVREAHEKYWSDLRAFRISNSDPECLDTSLAHIERMKAVSDTVLIQYSQEVSLGVIMVPTPLILIRIGL